MGQYYFNSQAAVKHRVTASENMQRACNMQYYKIFCKHINQHMSSFQWREAFLHFEKKITQHLLQSLGVISTNFCSFHYYCMRSFLFYLLLHTIILNAFISDRQICSIEIKNVLNKYGQKVQMGRSYIFRISFRCESSVQNDGIIISSLVACLTHAKKLNSSACFSSTCCTQKTNFFSFEVDNAGIH